MNTDQHGRGFEERLLDELRSMVARPSSSSRRPLRQPRAWVTSVPRRRVALVGGVAALLGVVAAAGVPFVTGGATPAYAVSANDDGSVTVEINSLSDAAGLQNKLREAGINAVVQYLPPGKACKQPWFTEAAPLSSDEIKGGIEHEGGSTRFTISKNLPADTTLVILTQVDAGDSSRPQSLGLSLAKGEVGPCELIDAPAGSEPFHLDGSPSQSGTLHTERPAHDSGHSTSESGTAAK
jgi:hypothetical protein